MAEKQHSVSKYWWCAGAVWARCLKEEGAVLVQGGDGRGQNLSGVSEPFGRSVAEELASSLRVESAERGGQARLLRPPTRRICLRYEDLR